MNVYSDEYFMRIALEQAQIAFENDEVPVGAVIAYHDKVIAKGHNLCEKFTDFTAHAEMQVLTSASNYLQNKYLNECTLYVTLEPCIMCAGATFWTKIGRIVFGACDEKRGFSRFSNKITHPKTIVNGSIMENECSFLLKSFFQKKR
jgi:tRNA(adenine34) deaminase